MEGLMLCGKGEAPQLLADGVTQRNGNLPVCPSGGLLGVGNPIAAAGLMKVIEIFLQLRGEAGKRQVPGKPTTGLAQAWEGEILTRVGRVEEGRVLLEEVAEVAADEIYGLWAQGLIAAIDNDYEQGTELARQWNEAELVDGEPVPPGQVGMVEPFLLKIVSKRLPVADCEQP